MARRPARSASQPLVAAVRGALAVLAITPAVLAGGCGAGTSAGRAVHHGAGRGSVTRCTQFGIQAIRRRVTVTELPPACRGLTRAQDNFAVGSALHSAADGVRGRALRRARIGQASRYRAALGRAVPATRGRSQGAGPPAAQPSRAAIGLAALGTWLATAGLGVSMMLRWLLRRRGRRLRRPPALNAAHLGLAAAGLAAWTGYLATGLAGLAWAGAALLIPVTGLGMSLVFLAPGAAGPPSAPGPRPRRAHRSRLRDDPARLSCRHRRAVVPEWEAWSACGGIPRRRRPATGRNLPPQESARYAPGGDASYREMQMPGNRQGPERATGRS